MGIKTLMFLPFRKYQLDFFVTSGTYMLHMNVFIVKLTYNLCLVCKYSEK